MSSASSSNVLRATIFGCLISAATVSAERAAMGALANGDIVYVRDATSELKPPDPKPVPVPRAIVQVDRNTGNRTILSQFGVRGAGPDIGYSIAGIDVSRRGDIYVGGAGGSAIFRIDPVSGDRTVISSPTVGSGPTFMSEGDLVVGPTGDLFVAREDSIFRVNPTTGDRSLVSGPGKGAGQSLVHVGGLTLTPTGNFYTLETSGPNGDSVFSVNGTTGDRTIISGEAVGGGPDFNGFGFDLELLPDGALAVVDHANRILRVDPASGLRSILAGPGVGSGPDLGHLEWLSLDSAGFLLASSDGAIFRVDPATGDRTIVTGAGVGTGPVPLNREAVEYVPEPSGLLLAGFGLAWAGPGSRRSRRCMTR